MLADSLLLELRYGGDFIELAEMYSKTNPSDGGLIAPFVKGKYNIMGDTYNGNGMNGGSPWPSKNNDSVVVDDYLYVKLYLFPHRK